MFAADNTHLMLLGRVHWVYIYNVETGACIHKFFLRDDGWFRSVVISSDGSGILTGISGAPRNVTLWNPGKRTWPVYHITRDGWVYAASPGKMQRLCWLPPEWREQLGSDEGILCIREAETERHGTGRVVALNMTQLMEYITSLDAQQ